MLHILNKIGVAKDRHSIYLCRCFCGNLTKVVGSACRATKSCGCLCRKHGESITKPSTYNIWRSMRHRCLNPQRKDYPSYGGRGIQVCERWNDYRMFKIDMGTRPSKKFSLDRINVDGNYEPGNCRWATQEQQNQNKRGSKV